ncbi:MAG TPA: type 4a pilus biogenesis protein PilO, partial [Vicinamibacterales bacterium]|nr:type 4a pilus biogenesis protein PilO [Vicinamibacterales bacterium]
RRLSLPPLGRGTEEAYAEWPIAVAIDGRYHDLAILFNRLGNFSRIMNVENIRISALANQESRTISADFIAKTFVYIEPKAPSEDAKGKPGKKKKR